MEQEVKERMKEVFAHYNTNPTAISKGDGNMQKRFSNQVFNGKRMSFDLFMTFLDRFPTISPDWLLNGEGCMFKSERINAVDLHQRLAKIISVNYDTDEDNLKEYIAVLEKLCTFCELEPRKPIETYDDARNVWQELNCREQKSYNVLTKHSYTGALKSIWISD